MLKMIHIVYVKQAWSWDFLKLIHILSREREKEGFGGSKEFDVPEAMMKHQSMGTKAMMVGQGNPDWIPSGMVTRNIAEKATAAGINDRDVIQVLTERHLKGAPTQRDQEGQASAANGQQATGQRSLPPGTSPPTGVAPNAEKVNWAEVAGLKKGPA